MPGTSLPDPILSDRVVSLRRWQGKDAATTVVWGRDPVIVRWAGVPADQTADMARRYLIEVEDARRAGRMVALAITRSDSGLLIGSCDVRLPDPGDQGLGEIGYLLGAEARGHGYATRAVWLLVDWCFGSLELGRVQALVHPENPRSARVLDRLGFQREGVLRRYRNGHHGREDRVIYSLLPGELKRPAPPA